jgi:hypothetical protein
MSHSPRYLRYATRDQAGRGDERRYWPGYRITPRAQVVLAQTRKFLDLDVTPAERALLLAILEEGDSAPVRAMREAGVDTAEIVDSLMSWTGRTSAQLPLPTIENGQELTEEQASVLQMMFRKHRLEEQVDRLRVEHVFQEGFSGSTVLLVRPIRADGRADAMVVVKLDERQTIQWEKARYDKFVKYTLPPSHARIEAEPVPWIAIRCGIRYSFIRTGSEFAPTSLSELAATEDSADIAHFIREAIYEGFRETWWGQSKPYQFQVWQEYDLLLPSTLIVESLPDEAEQQAGRTLRPLGEWNRDGTLRPGEIVRLEGFTALKTKRKSGVLQVAAGAGPEAIGLSGRIEVRGLDLSQKSYYRGEPVRDLVARVVQTRDDLLHQQLIALEPDFNILGDSVPYTARQVELPNPLRAYTRMLERRIAGTLSIIHGDLHTGNILISPGGEAWLIDFEWTRDGHTLFDWAVMEVSMLIDHVVRFIGPDWEDTWRAIELLDSLNHEGWQEPPDSSPLAQAFRPVAEIRQIVAELLAQNPQTKRKDWSEYQTALSLCALRVPSWGNRTTQARRLTFLASALAMDEVQRIRQSSEDATELTTDMDNAPPGQGHGSIVT